MILEEIIRELREGKLIEDVLINHDWHEFEEAVADILKNHYFKTKLNYRFKTNRRHEIDVLAWKPTRILVIECKRWSNKRYKTSALLKAAKKHKERVEELRKLRPLFLPYKNERDCRHAC